MKTVKTVAWSIVIGIGFLGLIYGATSTMRPMTGIEVKKVNKDVFTSVNIIRELDREIEGTKLKQKEVELLERRETIAREKAEIKAKEDRAIHEKTTNRGSSRGMFTATAYDLSYASTGKKPSHPAYGITASGVSLKGETLESARAIAVDPEVIRLGSRVHVEFLDEEWKHLSGIFTAVDTGGAIKENKIDVFFGSGEVAKEVRQFGRRKVKITVLHD